MEKDLVLVGGVARNRGFVDALERNLGVEVKVPEDPEYASALGAALSHD
jgi:activator of 2-hydroxyglutaryl-CoA dehydratase